MKPKAYQSKLKRLLFSFKGKKDINTHKSTRHPRLLIFIRVAAFLLLSFREVLSLQNQKSLFKSFEYLTIFGFTMTWLYFTVVVQDYIFNEFTRQKISKGLNDWANLLYELSICLQVPVTILYWLVLFDYNSQVETIDLIKDISQHGFPLFCILLDYCFNAYQFPRKHLGFCIFLGTGYLCLNLAYSLAIEPIYTPLDWVSVMCYVWVGSCYLIVILVHITSNFIWKRYRQDYIVENQIDPELKYEEFIDHVSSNSSVTNKM